MRYLLLWTLMASWCAAPCLATDSRYMPPLLKGVGIDQRLNAQVPLDTVFRDETGATVTLQKYFHGKPVLFLPVYYTCPMLCGQILSGMVAGLRPLSLKPGKDFEIVAMSFNPTDTPAEALSKQKQYSHSYSSSAGANGWNFLVGSQESIHRVTNALGFHYHWDAEHNMFVHASGIMALTPEGKIARYFYGVEYEPKDLKLGLIEASHDRIGSPVDQILLFCSHYDPTTGKYTADVINLLQVAAGATLALLIGGLVFLWRRDLRSRNHPI